MEEEKEKEKEEQDEKVIAGLKERWVGQDRRRNIEAGGGGGRFVYQYSARVWNLSQDTSPVVKLSLVEGTLFLPAYSRSQPLFPALFFIPIFLSLSIPIYLYFVFSALVVYPKISALETVSSHRSISLVSASPCSFSTSFEREKKKIKVVDKRNARVRFDGSLASRKQKRELLFALYLTGLRRSGPLVK